MKMNSPVMARALRRLRGRSCEQLRVQRESLQGRPHVHNLLHCRCPPRCLARRCEKTLPFRDMTSRVQNMLAPVPKNKKKCLRDLQLH